MTKISTGNPCFNVLWAHSIGSPVGIPMYESYRTHCIGLWSVDIRLSCKIMK